MKNVLLAFAFLIASTTAFSQKETIEGNGNLITRDVAVKSFTELKANGIYELKLIQGNTESVKIEADENLQDLFNVTNDGSKLVIDMKKMDNKNLKTKNPMRVVVTFKSLKDVEFGMVGNVKSDAPLSFNDLNLTSKGVGNVDLKLTANKINIENKGVGNMNLSGKAQNAVMVNSGVGSVKAGDFIVQTLDINNSGVGSAEVNAAKELKVKDSFLGKVTNKGAAPARKMNKVVI
ncbi:MAG: head GIN domain-containing protein [Chitinophagaceae bacterium]